MLSVHKFFISLILKWKSHWSMQILFIFHGIVCNGNDLERCTLIRVHRAHIQINQQTNEHSCKSCAAAVGNKACVRWARVCVCMCVRFTQREQIGSTTMPFRNSAFYLRAEFSFHMIRSDCSSSNWNHRPVLDVCCMLQTSCASLWLFAHPCINICSKRANWN